MTSPMKAREARSVSLGILFPACLLLRKLKTWLGHYLFSLTGYPGLWVTVMMILLSDGFGQLRYLAKCPAPRKHVLFFFSQGFHIISSTCSAASRYCLVAIKCSNTCVGVSSRHSIVQPVLTKIQPKWVLLQFISTFLFHSSPLPRCLSFTVTTRSVQLPYGGSACTSQSDAG